MLNHDNVFPEMKEKNNPEKILGLLNYFPKFQEINSKFFEITPGFNFAVAGCSSEFGFQLKIRALFFPEKQQDYPVRRLNRWRLNWSMMLYKKPDFRSSEWVV